MVRSATLLLICLSWLRAASAQEQPDTARLLALLGSIQDVYRGQPLSFQLQYTVAGEQNPSVPLDSMRGEVVMNGAHCYYRLPTMETITNPRYNIVLFKEDKLMYLAKPSTLEVQDPMLRVRSMIKTGKVSGINMEERGREQQLHVTFGKESTCNSMVLNIEKATGYLRSIQYELKTALMPGIFGMEMEEDSAAYGKHVIVRIEFTNYKTLDADLRRFDEKNFFFHDGHELKAVSAYSDYTIFKGTPNL